MSGNGPRHQLLKAALELFGERGFEGTSTRSIATRAGAHQQQITYHFGSKEQLWREAVHFVFADFRARVTSLGPPELHHEARLRQTVEHYLGFCRDNPQFAAITMWERAGPRGEWLESEVISPMIRHLYHSIFHRDMPPVKDDADIADLSFILLLCESSNLFTAKNHLARGFNVDVDSEAFLARYVDHVIMSLYPLSLLL